MENREKPVEIIKDMRRKCKACSENSIIAGEEYFIPSRDGKTRLLIYKAKEPKGLSPVFFDVHGGGFVTGLPEDDDKFCDAIRNELNITVVSIDYRLAPEYKFPCDKYDVYDTVSYVSSHEREFGIDSSKMAIGGHSSGANTSTVVAMMSKKEKAFSFKCQILDYPPTDLFTPAHKKFYTEGAIPCHIATLFDKSYRNDEDSRNPYCSPILALNEELQGLPPAIVITCEIDSLRDEGEAYAEKLIKAGVETTAKRFLGVRHGFTISKPELKESKEALSLIKEALKKYLQLA